MCHSVVILDKEITTDFNNQEIIGLNSPRIKSFVLLEINKRNCEVLLGGKN